MSVIKKFGESDLIGVLGSIGSNLKRKVSIYLIGGCAMTFMGAKLATKDIDLICTSTKDVKDLVGAMKNADFVRVDKLAKEYKTLGAWIVMERPDKMRFDVFDRQVCGKLEIDDNMQTRATFYKSFDNLDVYLMSGEDIFLFKGMTERTDDLDDMRILVERGIEWDAVKSECLSQKKSDEWAGALGSKLLDLQEKFGIKSPITKIMLDHTDMGLLERTFRNIIGTNKMTFSDISKTVSTKYGYSDSWTRKQLRTLVEKKIVSRTRNGHGYIFSIK